MYPWKWTGSIDKHFDGTQSERLSKVSIRNLNSFNIEGEYKRQW